MPSEIKNIAIIAGGDTAEANVSINSAREVMKYIDRNKWSPYLITIHGKEWYLETERGGQIPVDKNDFSVQPNGKKILFDCVFVAIHGSPGEDGKIQGYFDMLNIRYTTSNVLTLALTMNKFMTKEFVKNLGPKQAKGILLRSGDKKSPDEIISSLGLPLFVKPNNNGSSYGVTKVNKADELSAAFEKGFQYEDEILIEEFISGTEITCGMITRNEQLVVLPLTEIVSKKDFFDYDAKYVEGFSEEITPARIPESVAAQCREFSSRIYKSLNCSGMIRIDFIVKNEELFILEVNTVPGLTAQSIVPKQAASIGISFTELISIIIEETLR